MARHVVRGVRVDEEALAVDAIAQGAETGNFLALDHTAKHFREQFWFPRLMDRRRYGEWAADRSTTLGERVRASVRRTLDEHRAPPLGADVTAKLDRIVGRERQGPA